MQVGNRVRIGVEAPNNVRILRGELACWLDVPEQPRKSAPSEKADREEDLSLTCR